MNNNKSTATMQKGDMFIFRANVVHAWKNGPAGTLIHFVKQKAAS